MTTTEQAAEAMYLNGMLTNKAQIPQAAAILAAHREDAARVERERIREALRDHEVVRGGTADAYVAVNIRLKELLTILDPEAVLA